MGLGTSIVVFAVGAVLAFAISVTESHGVNWNTVGDILMGVGAFGVLVSIILWGVGPWGGVRRRSTYMDSTGRVVHHEDVNAPF